MHFWEFLLPCRSSGGVKVGNYLSCGLYAGGYLLEEAGVLPVGYWENKYPGEAKVKSLTQNKQEPCGRTRILSPHLGLTPKSCCKLEQTKEHDFSIICHAINEP